MVIELEEFFKKPNISSCLCDMQLIFHPYEDFAEDVISSGTKITINSRRPDNPLPSF